MARPPKALELHQQEGTFRADRHGAHPDLPKLVKVSPPKWFDTTRKRELKRMVDFWVRSINILTEADAAGLVALADWTCTYFEMAEYCAEHGNFETVITESGAVTKQSPQSKLKTEAFMNMTQLGARFGFTPSDRAKMFNAMRQAGASNKPKQQITKEKSW